jgi:hypothetical protein
MVIFRIAQMVARRAMRCQTRRHRRVRVGWRLMVFTNYSRHRPPTERQRQKPGLDGLPPAKSACADSALP